MLRVDRKSGTLTKLNELALGSAGITERNHLQSLILKNTDDFFHKECQEKLFVIGEEVQLSDEIADRIDLLAIDEEGKSVVIELKRGEHKLQLLQALSYASMIAGWTDEHFRMRVSADKLEAYDEFVSETANSTVTNDTQRILLFAEHYDFTVLSTAKWLTESFGMDITCYQLSLSHDLKGGGEYLSATQLFPARQLAEQARRRGASKSERNATFPTIEELLKGCANDAVRHYFEALIAKANTRRNRRRDCIVYPQSGGKMRFLVQPRRNNARVAQLGRFQGDQAFWSEHLQAADVRDRGEDLRFYLSTQGDLDFFSSFAEHEIRKQAWKRSSIGEGDSEAEA